MVNEVPTSYAFFMSPLNPFGCTSPSSEHLQLIVVEQFLGVLWKEQGRSKY
jgi:hypothetical protein